MGEIKKRRERSCTDAPSLRLLPVLTSLITHTHTHTDIHTFHFWEVTGKGRNRRVRERDTQSKHTS